MLMNKVLGDSKWMHSMCYIDDVVVFTKKKDFGLHLQHLQDVFTRLQRANLRLKAAKCEFATGEISFLGYRVGREGLKPCPKKIEAISQIAVPRTKKQVRSFLGLAGFYRNMIKMFSVTAEPLHGLTKAKNPERVRWTPECQKAFEALKEALTSHPVLQLPDMSLPFILETDASKMGIGAVLMQELEPGKMCTIAYASGLNSPAQKNYSVFDLELSAIVYEVTRFRSYLYGRTFTIVSDHKALRHLMSLTQPGGRLARWQLMLADYSFDIKYKPGSKMAFRRRIRRVQLVVPEDEEIRTNLIKWAHSFGCGGHTGASKTFQLLRQHYWWRNSYHSVVAFVRRCTVCQLQKNPLARLRARPGVCRRPTPTAPWETIHIDACKIMGKDVMLFVCGFTRWPEAMVFEELPNGNSLSEALIRKVVSRHGTPSEIFCDSVSYQASGTFRAFCERLNIRVRLTSAYQPQSNGLVESKARC
ncbi:unnamed protein product [Heterosigma akashiwo]